MKVKMICTNDNEKREIRLPMNEKRLLSIQGKALHRDTLGYLTGGDVKYYDEEGIEIENIFLLNKNLKEE